MGRLVRRNVFCKIKLKFTILSDPLVLTTGCCLFSFAIPPRNRQGMENLDLLWVVFPLGQNQNNQFTDGDGDGDGDNSYDVFVLGLRDFLFAFTLGGVWQ